MAAKKSFVTLRSSASLRSTSLILSLIILITSICSTSTAATQAEIDEAINKGVAWLASKQN